MLLDRKPKRVITHRVACGRPARAGEKMPTVLLNFEITGVDQDSDNQFTVDKEATEKAKNFNPSDPRHQRMRAIPIRVHSNKIEDFLTQSYTARAKLPVLDNFNQPMTRRGKDGVVEPVPPRLQVFCSGDGVQAKRRTASGDKKTIRCCASYELYKDRTPAELARILSRAERHNDADGLRCPYAQNEDHRAGPICKPETVFVFQSDVIGGIGSYCRYRSSGRNTADALVSSLRDIQRLMGGQLELVPLLLVLTPRPLEKNGYKKIQPTVSVELRYPAEQTFQHIDNLLAQRARIGISGAETPRGLLAEAVEQVDHELDLSTQGNRPGGNIPVLTPDLIEDDK